MSWLHLVRIAQRVSEYVRVKVQEYRLNKCGLLETGRKPKVSNRKKSRVLSDLYYRQDALGAKWITRILLKDMLPMSFSWTSILFALHPCASILYRM